MSGESTAVLEGYLERGLRGDAEARQRLLELTRDRLMGHARRLLHGRYARLEPFAQTGTRSPRRANEPPLPGQAHTAAEEKGRKGGPYPRSAD